MQAVYAYNNKNYAIFESSVLEKNARIKSANYPTKPALIVSY